MIQEAQNLLNNGGGGNLGYFQRGKKKKEDESSPSLFDDDGDQYIPSHDEDDEIIGNVGSDDKFVPSDKEATDESYIYKAKNFFKKINGVLF